PLAALDTRIETLRRTRDRSGADTRELRRLEAERRELEGTLYEALSAWQRVELARHVDRPQTLDYVQRLCTDFFELHGDRVIGEGGSGGALALGLADRLLMQEYSCYSVISPEGCSAILYRDRTPDNVARAAEALRLTARDLYRFGVIDEVVSEPVGGAHRNPRRAGEALGRAIARHL